MYLDQSELRPRALRHKNLLFHCLPRAGDGTGQHYRQGRLLSRRRLLPPPSLGRRVVRSPGGYGKPAMALYPSRPSRPRGRLRLLLLGLRELPADRIGLDIRAEGLVRAPAQFAGPGILCFPGNTRRWQSEESAARPVGPAINLSKLLRGRAVNPDMLYPPDSRHVRRMVSNRYEAYLESGVYRDVLWTNHPRYLSVLFRQKFCGRRRIRRARKSLALYWPDCI